MRDIEFSMFLESDSNIESKNKAVKSRLSRARKVEEVFAVNLDEVVKDDNITYELLKKIKDSIDVNRQGNHGNAVRKYYLFVNNKEFPKLSHFKRLI